MPEQEINDLILSSGINEQYENIQPFVSFNNNSSVFKNVLLDELKDCDEFKFAVAFIKVSGLYLLRPLLKELESRNIQGKILTTDYMCLTEPNALKMLNEFENIEVKVYPKSISGFHTKSYIFKKDNIQTIVIGSSNLTESALINNKEWNLKIQVDENSDLMNSINEEFNDLWEKSYNVDEIIDDYQEIFSKVKNTVYQFQNINEVSVTDEITPNSMQNQFINNLEELIEDEETKGLLVSATGTGKTYAAALAFKRLLKDDEKLLFVVHNRTILSQAFDSFKNIFNEDIKFKSLIDCDEIPEDYNILFSTRQTLTQADGLKRYDKFSKDEFDYIIIDEAHQSVSNTYLEILDYFEPKFILGMTATPDRTDERNVYELYDFNIVQDIRLQQALEEDLLCPFHYYGISEITVNGENIIFDDFNNIEPEKLADILLEMSKKYPNSGDNLKALVFCRNSEDGEILAELFRQKGHPSIFLDHSNSDDERLDAIESLESDDEGSLEYIFTIEIFNEGVDIPQVNQVLMIRPTKSSIIFIQQLGRGLRKHESKDCVVVLDLIGNYDNNYLIPFALTGDISYNIHNSFDPEKLPGNVTATLDEISSQRIFNSINKANRKGDLGINLFKKKFLKLFDKLGRIPYLFDFYYEHELDSMKILNHGDFKIYDDFLKKIFEDFNGTIRYQSYFNKFIESDDYIRISNGGFSEIQEIYLFFVSKLLANGIRPHELIILKELLVNNQFTIENVQMLIKERVSNELNNNSDLVNSNIDDYSYIWSRDSVYHAISILNMDYFLKTNNELNRNFKEFEEISFFEVIDGNYIIDDNFSEMLNDEMFKKHFIDVINFGLLRFEREYLSNLLKNHSYLKIHEFYSRDDVIRLLNWPRYEEPISIGGYALKDNDCIIFAKVAQNSNYVNEFIDSNTFSWSSANNTYLDDNDHEDDEQLLKIKNYKDNGLKIHLFANDGKNSTYCYLGLVDHENDHVADENEGKAVVRFKFKLQNEMNESIKNFLGVN